MRQLYYTIRYLLRGRGGNVIKVLSLTLGLGVGLILFARVAFELSFDTFFDQVEDLYSVHVRYNDDKTGEEDGSRILFAPIPERTYYCPQRNHPRNLLFVPYSTFAHALAKTNQP